MQRCVELLLQSPELLDKCPVTDLVVVPSLADDNTTPQQVISEHAKKVIDFSSDVEVSLKREHIWRKAKAFYKIGMNAPERLR